MTEKLSSYRYQNGVPLITSLQFDTTVQETLSYPQRNNKPRHHETFKTIAGIAGNVLEWYDFAVFGYFSDVLGTVFFPPDQPGNMALMESFAVFGGAFVMRPLGGLFMGYLGDVYGRKMALELSIFLMAIPTFCMGCLPTYEQIGCWSYILLIAVRLVQGLSVGGQLMSSLVFTLEGKPKQHWGLYGSYVMAAANAGTLLGGVVAFLLRKYLTYAQLQAWGWRLPFLSGILVCLCGLYLKYYCDEDDELHHHRHGDDHKNNNTTPTTSQNPLRLAFAKKNRRQLLAACMVPMLYAGGIYLSFVWLAIYMFELIPNPMSQAFGINSSAMFVSICVLFPIAGDLSDRYGRRRIMTIGGLTFGLGSPLLVMLIGQGNPYSAFVLQSLLGVSLSFWGAPMMAWLAESFEPSARLTSAAVGYNIGMGIAGGLSPALATYVVDQWGYKAPGFLLTVLAAISLAGLWVVAPPPESSSARSNNDSSEKQPLLKQQETANTMANDYSSEESLMNEKYIVL